MHEAEDVTGIRVVRKIMEMVGVLHGAGYEGLYLDSCMSPSGCHWRYEIGIARDGRWPQPDGLGSDADDAPRGSIGGDGAGHIPWCAPEDTVGGYAQKFMGKYERDLPPARHANPAYVAWYREMLERTAPEGILIFGCDMGPWYEHAFTWGPPGDFRMPMPPGFDRGSI